MLQAEQTLHDRYQLKQKLGQNAGRQTWLAYDLHTTPTESVIVKLLAFGGEVQWESAITHYPLPITTFRN
jgi:hypothetical protein